MNGVLLINKPENFTSRDVVNILSRILNTKKIGHTGTLDPIATGVLVVCIGNHTKLVDLLTSKDKEYIAKIKLGIKTDTGDITGNIIDKKEFNIDNKQIIEVLNTFLGESIQTVPKYSAVKVNGKKLYQYARNNETIDLPTRKITISKIELLDFKDDEIEFKVTVSKGTYIRSLIEDICEKLDTVGTMSSLVRTKQGNFTIEECYTIDDIKNNNYKLLLKEDILNDIDTMDIDEELYSKVKNGAIIDKIFPNNLCSFKYNNEIIAIYQTYHEDITKAKPYKMF